MEAGRIMAVIAATGDIGSGKSTGAKILARLLGCTCLDADVIAKDCWENDDVKAQAVSRWGNGILDAEGRIIRAAVAERIFSAKSEHDFCNALIHPLVMSKLQELTRNVDAVVEIPLLPEAGRQGWISKIFYYCAPFEIRAERCRTQRGWTVDELRRRESFLLPQSVRMSMCDYVIHNDGSLEALEEQLQSIIRR